MSNENVTDVATPEVEAGRMQQQLLFNLPVWLQVLSSIFTAGQHLNGLGGILTALQNAGQATGNIATLLSQLIAEFNKVTASLPSIPGLPAFPQLPAIPVLPGFPTVPVVPVTPVVPANPPVLNLRQPLAARNLPSVEELASAIELVGRPEFYVDTSFMSAGQAEDVAALGALAEAYLASYKGGPKP